MHPRDFGGFGTLDRDVLKRWAEHDFVLVIENARDFRALIATQTIYPGLIVLPCVGRARSEALLRAAIAFLSKRRRPDARHAQPRARDDHQADLCNSTRCPTENRDRCIRLPDFPSLSHTNVQQDVADETVVLLEGLVLPGARRRAGGGSGKPARGNRPLFRTASLTPPAVDERIQTAAAGEGFVAVAYGVVAGLARCRDSVPERSMKAPSMESGSISGVSPASSPGLPSRRRRASSCRA